MKKKGFTLIELLAVIIILGILMLIAIPSVTSYINNSRKNSYLDTVKGYMKGASLLANSGELDMTNPDAIYYIPVSCINTEAKGRSPYGEFAPAYVLIKYNESNYKYYFLGRDDQGIGVPKITKDENLNIESIETDIPDDYINPDTTFDARETIYLLDETECSSFEEKTKKHKTLSFDVVWNGPQAFGTTVSLISDISGYENLHYVIKWLVSYDGSMWQEIEGATGPQYDFVLTQENNSWWYRVYADVLDE